MVVWISGIKNSLLNVFFISRRLFNDLIKCWNSPTFNRNFAINKPTFEPT